MSGRNEPQGGAWLPLTEAAPRLGVPSAEALRRRIRRGRCPHQHRRGNAGEWQVLVPDVPDGLTGQGQPPVPVIPDATAELVAELRARVGALERRLDEGHTERIRLLELLSAERARVDQLLAAPAQRPRWWLWLRRGRGPFRGGTGMSPNPRDRQDLWYWAAVAGVILVLLVIAWATGWFGDVAPPESAPVIPRAPTQ